MSENLVLIVICVLFAIALWRIWGREMLKDIFLSPIRRYDFDEDTKQDDKEEATDERTKR